LWASNIFGSGLISEPIENFKEAFVSPLKLYVSNGPLRVRTVNFRISPQMYMSAKHIF